MTLDISDPVGGLLVPQCRRGTTPRDSELAYLRRARQRSFENGFRAFSSSLTISLNRKLDHVVVRCGVSEILVVTSVNILPLFLMMQMWDSYEMNCSGAGG
jgi:hypothetical protein